MDARLKGKLLRWNDEKGYGFIEPDSGGNQLFIHISAFKNRSRRPVLGDVVYYQLEIGGDGKAKATNASIEGVSVIRREAPYASRNKRGNIFSKMTALVIVVVIAWSAYHKLTERMPDTIGLNKSQMNITTDDGFGLEIDTNKYQCDGRVHCSEMTSREEAEYFVRHCPGTMMDGDHDGEPCENDSRF